MSAWENVQPIIDACEEIYQAQFDRYMQSVEERKRQIEQMNTNTKNSTTNTMLQAKTREQADCIERVVDKYLKQSQPQYCKFLYGNVYKNATDLVEINIMCGDCDNYLSIDIPFDMMAEIADYLRKENETK